MSSAPRLVLYGSSVFLAGLLVELRRNEELEVLALAPCGQNAVQCICALCPFAVLFDLGAEHAFAVSLLHERPDISLIGVDPSSDQLLVLSGRHAQPESVSELVRVVTEQTGAVLGSANEHKPAN